MMIIDHGSKEIIMMQIPRYGRKAAFRGDNGLQS